MTGDFVLIWQPAEANGLATSEVGQRLTIGKWRNQQSGLLSLFTRGDVLVEELGAEDGFIIGECYATHVPSRALDGREDTRRRIVDHLASGNLAEIAWGSFIAAHGPTTAGRAEIYASPFAVQPVFFVHRDGATLVASSLKLLRNIRPDEGLDEQFIARSLILDGFPSSRTALKAIQVLRSGVGLIVDHSGARLMARWNAADIAARSRPVENWLEAEELVHRQIRRSVLASVNDGDRILLDFSGGLDSAAIAGVTADHGADLCLVNFQYGMGSGDERSEARVAARHLGVDLIVRQLEPSFVDLEISSSAHLPQPVAYAYMQGQDRAAVAVAGELGCNVGLNGAGGDNVFCHLNTSAPLADCLRSFGPWRKSAITARHVAGASNSNYFDVLTKGVKKAIWGSHPRFYRDQSLLSNDVDAADFDELEHPWLASAKTLAPGTYEHIASIARADFFSAGYNRSPAYNLRYPLLSQPLVEACLRIPTWMWIQGGMNRAVTRSAVRNYLPIETLRRVSKGGHEDFNIAVFYRNIQKIRSMLLDGHLAASGILDRGAVSAALAKSEVCPPSIRLRLLRLVDFEAWLMAVKSRS